MNIKKEPCRFRASTGSASVVVQNNLVIGRFDSTTETEKSQDFADTLSNFTEHKKSNVLLSDSYKRIGLDNKSDRVSECGTFLSFARFQLPNGQFSPEVKLYQANFCRDRLCPMCSWRLSLKQFGQLSQIFDYLLSSYDYEYLFLTLTVPNVPGPDLKSTLDRLSKALHSFLKYNDILKINLGFFRSLEVSRNDDMSSKSYGTYHPHYHLILAVPKGYFTSRNYIKRDRFLELWQRAYKDSSITQVYVHKIDKPSSEQSAEFLNDCIDELNNNKSLGGALAEVGKYCIKPSSILKPFDPVFTDDSIKTLSSALKGRRLVAYGGIFELIRNKLGFDDLTIEKSSLNDDFDYFNAQVSYLITRYGWSSGVYKIIDEKVLSAEQMQRSKGNFKSLDIEVDL